MALFIFTKPRLAGEPIDVFNHGNMQRDFTYIDDIVEGMARVMQHPATASPHWRSAAPDPPTSSAPFRIHNIGGNSPVEFNRLIEVLEEAEEQFAIRCRSSQVMCRRHMPTSAHVTA
ncbi:NAD-dependent epimerase/dehydratase family protein [Mesorhizobium sp.]|uniref:NAD-dependent epimerase/dehydratase family protein n=1 Tax=Mesorhizobium sp. TaxID=1871066 RepID=UPI0025B9E3C8|nr:NAD-dependent epimerase/dehydratase family protein [Mesorhizobium sp.]